MNIDNSQIKFRLQQSPFVIFAILQINGWDFLDFAKSAGEEENPKQEGKF